jgi:phosphoribosylformylglycinamidine synthase subunit PurS
MDFVPDSDFIVLGYDKPFAHDLRKNRGQKRSPNHSANNPSGLVADCYHLSAVAVSAIYFPFLHYHIFDFQKQDCMNFSVQVKVMPLKELLDPQGKAVMGGLQNLGIKSVQDVRIGKTIQLQVDASSPDEAKQIAEDASRKLLANPVMEYFEISLT